MLFCFFGELIVGNLWKILFNVKLWDYRDLPFHVTRYAGLISTLGFSTGAYLIFKFIYMPVIKWLKKSISYKCARNISIVLGILILSDFLILIFQIGIFNRAPVYWKIYL